MTSVREVHRREQQALEYLKSENYEAPTRERVLRDFAASFGELAERLSAEAQRRTRVGAAELFGFCRRRYAQRVMVPLCRPMRLLRIPDPFDHPEFIFEPKLDGFRALAHIRGHRCELVSRNGHVFKSWPQLAEELAHAVRCRSAVLDGEICYLEPDGRTHFNSCCFVASGPTSTRSIS
jgi:bifunctional non-homologous end joining protein LigD